MCIHALCGHVFPRCWQSNMRFMCLPSEAHFIIHILLHTFTHKFAIPRFNFMVIDIRTCWHTASYMNHMLSYMVVTNLSLLWAGSGAAQVLIPRLTQQSSHHIRSCRCGRAARNRCGQSEPPAALCHPTCWVITRFSKQYLVGLAEVLGVDDIDQGIRNTGWLWFCCLFVTEACI